MTTIASPFSNRLDESLIDRESPCLSNSTVGAHDAGTDDSTRYDRSLLLAGAKRNTVLDLWQVERYGNDSYGDADYVSIFGLRPAEWYALGIRLLGRTAVECTRDDLGAAIGADIAAVAARSGATTQTVIDPFAGSGNTLFWLLRHLPQARGLGFELDAGVFELTRKNLAALALPIDILNVDYRSGLRNAAVGANDLLVVFVAPPWGDALDPVRGLDLRRTEPPIGTIVDGVLERFAPRKILCAVQVHETVDATSMTDLTRRFDGSALRLYALNAAGRNTASCSAGRAGRHDRGRAAGQPKRNSNHRPP